MSPAVILVLSLLTFGACIYGMFTTSLIRATYSMVALGALLTAIYITYGLAVDNPYLFAWAGVCAITRIWLLPFFKGGLLYSAWKMAPEKGWGSALLGTALFVVVALIGLLWLLGRVKVALSLTTNLADLPNSPMSINLLLAALLVLFGVLALTTHRHPFKMVLGILIVEAGIHLGLVHLVPRFLATVQMGIFSNFVGSIFMILFINRQIVERLQVTDTVKLSELKH